MPFQAPPPELAPDLDLRPGEPTRSTLGRWLQTCRACRATAPDLHALPARLRPVLDGAEYQALAGGAERPFLRWATLAQALDDPHEAAGALLQAAWVLDDGGNDQAAAALRRRAAAAWGQGETVQDALRVLDALRRAGDMDAVRAQAEHLAARPGLEETDIAVLRYQEALIATGDTARHLMSSALRPPARTPHVTHGRMPSPPKPPPAKPFWQRLLGK